MTLLSQAILTPRGLTMRVRSVTPQRIKFFDTSIDVTRTSSKWQPESRSYKRHIVSLRRSLRHKTPTTLEKLPCQASAIRLEVRRN